MTYSEVVQLLSSQLVPLGESPSKASENERFNQRI